MTTISFCIITSGTEDDQLKRTIDSIIALNIPTYEIVVVGGNSEISNISNRIKWVPFDESSRASEIVDNKPGRWITRKKNLSVQNAQYEVCVVIHDYIQFDSNWWIEFEKFGTHWDICVHQILNILGTRAEGFRIDNHPLLPRDCMVPWDMIDLIQYMGISGNYQCIKRERWLEEPMNENLLWGQAEEMEWSRRVVPKFHIKANPHCIVRCGKPRACDYRQSTEDIEKMQAHERVFAALRECRIEKFVMYYEPNFNNNVRKIFL
jgi:glycosyltransferase involved in cell wall biosynthesis